MSVAVTGCAVPTPAFDAGAPVDAGAVSASTCATPHEAAAALRRLTPAEYDATVHALLHTTRSFEAALPTSEGHGFSTAAQAQVPSSLLTEQLQLAAETLASEADLARVLPCPVNDACLDTFLATFGRRAFRRPLSDGERARLRGIYERARLEGDAADAFRLLLEVMLQAPQFLYRLEPQPLDDFAVATRLSFFLTGTTPDDVLLDLAAMGRLSTQQDVEGEAARLLETPAAVEVIKRFHREWLGVTRLQSASKDAAYGDFTALRESMEEEVGLFGAWATLNDGHFETLFTGDLTFLDANLGRIYGLPVADDGAFHATPLLRTTRRGVLTLPGVLAAWAKSDQSSPVLRGVFVRERLLCEALPSPPANAMVALPPPTSGTTRARLAAHSTDPQCAGCHVKLDPVGFLFEHYDAVGAYRATENGAPIDATGQVNCVDELAGALEGTQSLGAKLATSPTARRCLATQWLRFATGRSEAAGDACAIANAVTSSEQSLRALIISIAASDALRLRAP